MSRRGRQLASRIARNKKLQHVPSLPPVFRRRFASPKRSWPEFEREIPVGLRSYPGVRLDEKLANEAYAEEPLQDFVLTNAVPFKWLAGAMWRAMLPVSPRYWRARLRAMEANKVQPAGSGNHPEVDHTLMTRLRELSVAKGLSALGVAAYDERYVFEQWKGQEVGDRMVVCILEQAYTPTQQIPSAAAEQTALSTYAECIDIMCELADLLKGHGYRAQVHDASGRAMAIPFAVAAGLGQLGLNGQLLTPAAGSRCRILLMNTDAPLPIGEPRDFGIPTLCDECKVCVSRCPAGAIPATRRYKRGVEKAPINTKRCLPVIGQAHGCAVCMKVCPVQRFGLTAVLDEYERSGTILGKGTDDLEGYHWPLDGKHYGPGVKPRLTREVIAPAELPPLQLSRPSDSRQLTVEEAEQLRAWS